MDLDGIAFAQDVGGSAELARGHLGGGHIERGCFLQLVGISQVQSRKTRGG